MIKEHDKSQEKDDSCHSDQSGKRIAQRSKSFLILCIAAVFLIAIIFWGLKSFSPYASESSSDLPHVSEPTPGSKAAFIAEIDPKRKAVDLLQKEMLGIADKLVAEFPSKERLRILAAEAHELCYNYPEAKALLKEGIRLNPEYGDFYQRFAGIAVLQGEYDKAVTYWKKALEVSPKRLTLYVKIADALMSSGKYRQAIEVLQKKIKMSQGSSRVYYLLGQGYLQLAEYDESKKYFEKAIEIRPNYPDAHYGLSKVYMRLKQPDKAKGHIKIFKKWKAGVLRSRNKISKRDNFVVHDLTTDGELEAFPEIFVKLCIEGNNLYKKNNNLDKASMLLDKVENTFVQAIKFAPQAPGLYRELAFFYLVMNAKLTEAKELANKALSLEKSAKNYYILCVGLYKNSDKPGALKALEKAVELDPDNLRYRRMFDEVNRNK